MQRGGRSHIKRLARANRLDEQTIRRVVRCLGWDDRMVVIAASPLRRLLGLAACVPSKMDGLDDASIVMVFPSCASVHTWFMRRAIDIVFAGPEGEVLTRFDGVPPWRIRSCRGAWYAIERFSAG